MEMEAFSLKIEAFSTKSTMSHFPEGGDLFPREMNTLIFLIMGAVSPWR
jgi:hypothetical protein